MRVSLALAYEQSHEGYGQQPYKVGQTDSFVSLCNVPDYPAIDQCEPMHVRLPLVHATDTDQQESAVAHATPATISHPLDPSQAVYNWLIRPVETQLVANGVKTLAFVPDGAFRNIPIAALYDGKQYLVQKYSVAIAPGLQLVDPKPLARQKLQVLAFGLSEQ